jgi:hypothetical protein
MKYIENQRYYLGKYNLSYLYIAVLAKIIIKWRLFFLRVYMHYVLILVPFQFTKYHEIQRNPVLPCFLWSFPCDFSIFISFVNLLNVMQDVSEQK